MRSQWTHILVEPLLIQKSESEDSSEEEENNNDNHGGVSNERWLTPNYREPLVVNSSP